MQIHSLLKIGVYHTNHCEDALFIGTINETIQVIAVMDGCSSGIESHFAAALFKKILQKIVIEEDYKSLYQPVSTLHILQKELLQRFFETLQHIKNQLLLKTEELLSTLILTLIDTTNQATSTVVIGDGLVAANGILYEFEQDNRPNYIAYHLSDSFEEWYKNQQHYQQLSFPKITDFSISTDGIFSFKKWINTSNHCGYNLPHYFLNDIIRLEEKEAFHRKTWHLEENFGMLPMDDLAIIRVIF